MHGAGVGGSRRDIVPIEEWHRGDEGEHLVRRPLEIAHDRLVFGGQLGIDAQSSNDSPAAPVEFPATENAPRS